MYNRYICYSYFVRLFVHLFVRHSRDVSQHDLPFCKHLNHLLFLLHLANKICSVLLPGISTIFVFFLTKYHGKIPTG